MKKTIAILLVLTMVLSMIPLSGVFAATATTLYLKPSSNWKQSNARFAAYFFGNGEKWVSMTDTDKDGIYEVTVPAGYPNVIFCRMNPSASANNWNNKWNQTADLKVPTNGTDLYTVKEGTWDKGGGTWSVYGSSGEGGSVTPPPASDPVYRVVGSAGLCGSDWNTTDDNNKMEKQADGTYKKVYTNVAAGSYELKVVEDGSIWIPDGMGNNITVTALEGATVTVTYNPSNTQKPVTAVAEGGTTPAVPVEHIYRVAGSAGLCGSDWNGTDDNNKMEKQADGTYKKVYTNVAAGTYALKVVKDGSSWIPDGMGNDIPVTALEGATVTVIYDPSNTETPVTAIAEGGSAPIVPVEHDYYVVGEGSIFGDTTWGNAAIAANKMEKQDDGTYKKVYTDVAAGVITLKVHDPLLGNDGWWGNNDTNISVTAKQGATLTITFNAETKAVTAIAEGGSDPVIPVDPVYRVAGSAGLCGNEWNATDDNNKMEKQADGTYKKVYTNVAAGTYALKVVKDGTTYIPDGMGNDISVTALEGATVTVIYDPSNTETPVTAIAEGGSAPIVPVEHDYYVVGEGSIFGDTTWGNAAIDANKMEKQDDGTYKKVYTNVAAGTITLKVHDPLLGNDGWWGDNDSNISVTAKQGATLTITFNAETKAVTAVAEGGTDSEGEGEGEGTVTPPAADPVYRVAGTSSLCGSEWNGADDNNKMEKQADGTYKKVYTNVAAGTHGLKIVKDGNTWIPDGFDNEIKVTAKQGATVTVIFNPADNTITATATGGTDSEGEGEGTVTPPPATNDVYHVVGSGSIFAADWTIADADKMEKQSDGTYKKVYTGVAKGNLGIKVVKNNTTWIPDGFDNEIKAEVTTDNSTVTVTYNPSTGKIDVKINNKEAGSASGTPEGGNQGGSQGGTSTVKEITIYAKVPASWTAPKVWAWKGTQNVATGAWPGNLNMTKGANGWWSIKITSDIEGVLICNENGTEQTADVKVTTSGANIYITVGEKQADGKYAATSKFESVPSNGDETALFGMVVVMMTAVLGMGITVVSKKKFF